MPGRAQLLQDLVPPLVWRFAKKRMPWLVRACGGHFTHIRFEGDFPSWDAARRASGGYDAPAILRHTREALLKVKRGESRWEQDGMVSDSDEAPSALLAALARAAATGGGRTLKVLDFGGSLGSTYFRCRPFFDGDFKLDWSVVEQPEHVKTGKSGFEDGRLSFHFTVDEVLEKGPVDVLLLSGVLHYLPEPEVWLENLRRWPARHLILDRTPLRNSDRHRLTVQHVPREIYAASYPAWFFSKARIFQLIERDHSLLWHAPETEHWELGREVVRSALYLFQRVRS